MLIFGFVKNFVFENPLPVCARHCTELLQIIYEVYDTVISYTILIAVSKQVYETAVL